MAMKPTAINPRTSHMRASRIATPLRFARALAWALALAAGIASAQSAFAEATASHRVTVRVEPVSALSLQGGDIELAVPQSADGAPTSAANATCSLDWLTNQPGQKITVASSLPHPRLPLTLEAVSAQGGSPVGAVVLEGAAQDLVVSLTAGTGGCGLRYTAQSSGLDTPSPETHVITYTLTDRR